MQDPYDALVGHIHANLAGRIRVHELATVARLSAPELARALRRDHATTPYGLVLAVRIGKARAMLDAGAAIADTAMLTGFADQSHFTRHFKRVTGMTPLQFTAAAGRVPSARGRDVSRTSPRTRPPAAASPSW